LAVKGGGDRRQETGDRRQETGDRRQETGVRSQESGVDTLMVRGAGIFGKEDTLR
jgi:hypothetical protein